MITERPGTQTRRTSRTPEAAVGKGTNIQTRCVALHHLDAPWRPADVAQREGRIIRQGNLNPEVQVIRWITAGSFDAYMWQTLDLLTELGTGPWSFGGFMVVMVATVPAYA